MEQQNILNELTVDSTAAEEIKSLAKWAKFLSIIGFIFCGLIVIVGIFAGSIFTKFNKIDSSLNGTAISSAMTIVMALFYIAIAIVYFFPTLFLFQSAIKLKESIETGSQDLFITGLAKLKACFRFWGILTIIILGFYSIMLLISLLFYARL